MIRLLVNLLFPKYCISCSREGTHLCEDCLSLISVAQTPSFLFSDSPLSGLFCATSWQDGLIKKTIHMFKYPPFLRDLAFPLASLMIAHFSLIDKPSFARSAVTQNAGSQPPYLIVPVPLSKRRLKWRGFNHSEAFAKELSRFLGIPVCNDVLVKIKHTPPQAELPQEERRENMRGVFEVKGRERVRNRKILLVDDVFTTGSTMEEAAKVLRQAQAKQVFGIVVARG
ncbi:MAG: ComF family protein [Patescibacteria group bacterium]